MSIAIIIVLILCFLALLCIAFFLFAIWRALLGKSTVDLKLNTTITAFNKKADKMSSDIADNSVASNKLATELRELTRFLKSDRTEENGK